MLLIDYFETSAAYLKEKKDRLKTLEQQYNRIYDRDIKLELTQVRKDIRKKASEINVEILYNLEEFQALRKYFPELLDTYMEDEYIGRYISKKSWLLDYKPLPQNEATAKFRQIISWRAECKDAKIFVRKWVGRINARSITATYPVLKGYISKDMDKDEALEVIKKVDKILLREGWLVLITESLIQIPLAKFMTKIVQLRYEEVTAAAHLKRMMGKGTIAETIALRKLQEISRKREHYENITTQILLANPGYLRSLKAKKDWLSREKGATLEKFAKGITPHTIKERAWLDEMKKKLSTE